MNVQNTWELDVEGSTERFTSDELVYLTADNPDLFYQIFFPKTVRQGSASFHLDMDGAMEDPAVRYLLLKMFRGSAKTTRLRMTMARRIALGLSQTIFFIGASEGHATRSVKWIRKQIEVNKLFTGVFGLEPGSKWQEHELEVHNTVTGETCWVLGSGISGSIRGVNFDDYRPDFIVCDDVLTDESATTEEQREKLINLIDGAVRNSLAPPVDDPNAKMVVAQTPIARGDLTEEMEADPQVRTIEVPIWTKETLDSPLDQQESRWPERVTTEEARDKKRAAVKKNRLSIFCREYEVRLVSPEKRAFRDFWIQPLDTMPEITRNVLAIDPLPPPSEREVAKGLVGKDYEALVVVGQRGHDYFIRDYEFNRGHEPNWTVTKFFELAAKHKVFKVVVEAVGYQRTLKWIFEQEMKRRGVYYMIETVADKRSKYNKIVSTLSGIASNGHLYCRSDMQDLIAQFIDYPEVQHDDILDAAALGLSRLIDPVMELGADDYMATVANPERYRVPRLRGSP